MLWGNSMVEQTFQMSKGYKIVMGFFLIYFTLASHLSVLLIISMLEGLHIYKAFYNPITICDVLAHCYVIDE